MVFTKKLHCSKVWLSLDFAYYYLKVTIICRYIFLQFWLETPFASTKFCDLNVEMVQGRQILIFYTTIVHIANDCGYNILRFWANPQKYQTLVPAKNSHFKVNTYRQSCSPPVLSVLIHQAVEAWHRSTARWAPWGRQARSRTGSCRLDQGPPR